MDIRQDSCTEVSSERIFLMRSRKWTYQTCQFVLKRKDILQILSKMLYMYS